MMNAKPLLLVLASGLLLGGCNGAFWGNLVVLGITVGIFVGTLSLGRSTAAAEQSASSTEG
ncbi:MAG: hypothetical protein AAGF12_35760 [Myxococcota bacterium]